jgi:hypothetical protein
MHPAQQNPKDRLTHRTVSKADMKHSANQHPIGIMKGSKLLVALSSLLLTILLVGCSPSTPKGVAEKFLNALYHRNFAAVADYVSKDGEAALENLADENPRQHQPANEIEILSEQISGDEATVTYYSGLAQKEIHLVSEGGEWKAQFENPEQWDNARKIGIRFLETLNVGEVEETKKIVSRDAMRMLLNESNWKGRTPDNLVFGQLEEEGDEALFFYQRNGHPEQLYMVCENSQWKGSYSHIRWKHVGVPNREQ